MADDSHETPLVEEPLLLEEPVVQEETLIEPEEEIPTVSSPVSTLNFASVVIPEEQEHVNGESNIIIHEDEPEVSFERQEDHSQASSAPWKDGMTPRAVQMEASHAEEIESLKLDLENARAEVARLQSEAQEKADIIAKQQSEIDKLSKPVPVSEKPVAAKPANGTTPKPIVKNVPAKATTSAKDTAAKKPVSTLTPSKPVTAKPTATTAKTVTSVKPTPVAPPVPSSGGSAKKPYGDSSTTKPAPVRKLAVASPSKKPAPTVRASVVASPSAKPVTKTVGTTTASKPNVPVSKTTAPVAKSVAPAKSTGSS